MPTKTWVHFQHQEGKALQKVGMSKEKMQKKKEIWKTKLVLFPDSQQILPFSKSCAKHSVRRKAMHIVVCALFNINGTE